MNKRRFSWLFPKADSEVNNIPEEDKEIKRNVDSVGSMYESLSSERVAALRAELEDLRRQQDETMLKIGREVLRR